MWPLAIPFKLIGQSEVTRGQLRRVIELPGAAAHPGLCIAQLMVIRHASQFRAPSPEFGEDLDSRIEGPTAPLAPAVAGGEDLEELARNAEGRARRVALPPAEFASIVIAAKDRAQAVDLGQHPRLSLASSAPVVGGHGQFERSTEYVLVIEDELVGAGYWRVSRDRAKSVKHERDKARMLRHD